MEIQPVTYRGRTVAACTRRSFFLCDEIQARPADDPTVTFVLAMVLYACDIALGRPGPYRDADAVRHARRALIPAELLDRPAFDLTAAAAWLIIPIGELRAAARRAPGVADRRLVPAAHLSPDAAGTQLLAAILSRDRHGPSRPPPGRAYARECHMTMRNPMKLKHGPLIAALVAMALWPAASTADAPLAREAVTCADYPNQAAAQRAADTRDPTPTASTALSPLADAA